MNRHLVRAAILVAVALALTGCGRAATPGTAPATPPPVSATPSTSGTTAPATAAGSATDAGTLDGISKDLNSADSANAQTDADQHNADQAATTSDG